MSYFVLGSTGLVGLHFLKYISGVGGNAGSDATTGSNGAVGTTQGPTSITTLTRRAPGTASAKINSIVETDTSLWPKVVAENTKDAKVYYSAFGTTRTAAGSAENFKKIDYGINYDAAKAAKESGAETLVLISTISASSSSRFLYLNTKGKLEDDLIALKFPRTIILRPGVLLGDRDTPKGFLNDIAAKFSKWTAGTPLASLTHGTDVGDLAKVTYHLIQEDFDKSNPSVKILEGGEIIKLAAQLKK